MGRAQAPSPAAWPLNLSCLNGVRAACSIAVVLHHCFVMWRPLLPADTAAELTRGSWLLSLAENGAIAVDFLFVLSACLATYTLLPAMEGGALPSAPCSGGGGGGGQSCAGVVAGYWRKRAARILPAYLLANLLFLATFLPGQSLPPAAQLAKHLAFAACPKGVGNNLLFLTNAGVTATNTCGGHLWSVAVQVHAYVALPLLLWALRPRAPGFRRRLAAALVAAFAAGTLWRVWSAFASPLLALPLGDLSRQEENAAALAYLAAVYFPTASRVAELAVGAALGLLLRSPPALGWLRHRPLLVSGLACGLQAAVVQLLATCGGCRLSSEPRWPPTFARLFAALLSYGSPLYACMAATTLLALMLRADPLHGLLGRALAAPAFRRLADLSYSLYLLHEVARFWLVRLLLLGGALPSGGAREPAPLPAPLAAFGAIAAATLAVGYAAAGLSWHLVERRF